MSTHITVEDNAVEAVETSPAGRQLVLVVDLNAACADFLGSHE